MREFSWCVTERSSVLGRRTQTVELVVKCQRQAGMVKSLFHPVAEMEHAPEKINAVLEPLWFPRIDVSRAACGVLYAGMIGIAAFAGRAILDQVACFMQND